MALKTIFFFLYFGELCIIYEIRLISNRK